MIGPSMHATGDRNATLNAAALQLLSVADDTRSFAAIRQLISPLTTDPAEPEWVRRALATGVDLLDKALVGTIAHDSAVARVGALLELVMHGADGTVPGAPDHYTLPDDTAHELFPEFIAESLDYVQQIERSVLKLEKQPHDRDMIDVVFRAFHTIKSTSSFLGLDPIAALAHNAESLLSQVRDGSVAFSGTCADLSLRCADALRELLLHATVDTGEIPLPAGYPALLAQLQAFDPGGSAAVPVACDVPPQRADSAPDGGDSWVRVRTERLDALVDLIGELVVAQSMVAQDGHVLHDRHGALARRVGHSGKIVRELQGLGMSLRMVPLQPVFQRLQRLARDVARDAGKQVELVTAGEDTEIDRSMVDIVADPLVHMVRNAIDHGVESPEERVAAGKPACGTLRLTAHHAGGDVVVQLQDDGRGLDHDRILARARASGMVDAARELSASEIANLIFAPGLSTAETLTSLSGRGVGMDVVRRNVEALRGRIEIDTASGRGTTFTLRLPLTLALTDGMLVRVGAERYILPIVDIELSIRPAAASLSSVPGAGELVMLHGAIVPIVRLHTLFDVADAVTQPAAGVLVVIVHAGRRYALLVDELLGQHQFVAKPVGGALGRAPGVAGAAVLGDGRVGLILDVAGVIAAR